MRSNPCLEAVLTELGAAGVRDYQVLRRGRRHLQVRWPGRMACESPLCPESRQVIALQRNVAMCH